MTVELERAFRLLVVEDHEESAQAMCRLITAKLPYAICQMAFCLEEGLTNAIDFRAHFTLLDLGIPAYRGGPILPMDEVIRSIDHFPPPVGIMTDAEDPDDYIREKCIAFGAKAFFSKKILRDNLGTLDRDWEGKRIIEAITGAHLRRVLPTMREEYAGDARG